MKELKQGVSTISRTRLWRKPGQANRLGDGFAGNGTVIMDGFGLPEGKPPNRTGVWRHG